MSSDRTPSEDETPQTGVIITSPSEQKGQQHGEGCNQLLVNKRVSQKS